MAVGGHKERGDILKNIEYKPATAELVLFDNSDVVATSGGENGGCVTWSSQNGHECHGGLQHSGGDLKPPLS